MNFLVPLVLGLLMYAVIAVVVRAPGQALSVKFQKLGDLRGKRLEEIVAAAGQPRAVSAMPDGGTLQQWSAAGYRVALRFDPSGVCQGVQSRTRA